MWGGLVGLFTGVVTVAYRFAVHEGNHAVWHSDFGSAGAVAALLRFSIPAIGGLVVGFILYRLLDHRPGHGIPSIIHSVQTNQIRIPWKMAVPSAASVLVLTSGGSAGPEGPVAEIGSVFGSNMGSAVKAHQKTIRTLVGAGVAAAISAVFGAPIGGVFFALEVIFQGFELTLFGPVLISAVVAAMVSQSVFGREAAIHYGEFEFSGWEFPAYIGLGIFTGLTAAFFIYGLEFCTSLFGRIRLPLWVKPSLGGLGVGLLGLFLPQVIGEGYDFLADLFNPATNTFLWLLVLILLGKILATSLTLGSGSPGGCFAPSIFIGASLGGLYGGVLEYFSPDIISGQAPYALMGMAGMIAGTFNAPMTAILITLHVTQDSVNALVPLMTTVALSTFVMSRWDNVSVYTQILKRHGQWFPNDYDKDPLLAITVQDVLRPNPPRFSDSLTVSEAVARISNSEDTAFVVENGEGIFRGIVTLNDLRLALADPVMGKLVNLEDVLDTTVPRLSPSTNLREAVREFASTKVEALPVFDGPKRFLGLITRESVLTAYRQAKESGPASVTGGIGETSTGSD